MSFAKEILVWWDSRFESIPRRGSTEGKKTGNLRPETGKVGPRMDANPRESLEGCPPWQPQIQACRHRYEKIHLTEPQSTRRGKTGKQILAREWTRILGGLSSVAAPDPGAQAPLRKKYISRSHKAHGGGKPESRFWPATPIPACTSEIDMRCRFPLSVRVCSYE
jgi:hypothetical protein